jgi:hypothetical protein
VHREPSGSRLPGAVTERSPAALHAAADHAHCHTEVEDVRAGSASLPGM